MVCSIEECPRIANRRGYCETHYKSMWSKGLLPKYKRPSVEERFWSKVHKTEGCWLWTGSLDVGGYGRFSVTHSKGVKAHRWSYIASRGAIPEGLMLDHLCRVRSCVRPDHLEAVDCKTNLERSEETWNSRNSRKTHCPHGHPYDQVNTYVAWGGRRVCRTCRGERNRAQREREAASRQPKPQKTHCQYGHPFDEANTYWHDGKRQCRECKRRRNRNRKR